MKNYIQNGTTITLTAGGSGVSSGDLVTVGAVATGFCVIAKSDALDTEEYEAQVGGVVELPKDGSALAQGIRVSWDTAENEVTDDAPGTGQHRLGTVWKAAADSDDTVWVKLNDNSA